MLDAHEGRVAALEAENRDLKRDLRDLRILYEDLEQRVERVTITVGVDSTQDRLVQPISQQLNSITTQISDLNRTSARAHRTNEQAVHEIKGEMSNMQMMLHDLRGELMALQHAQYYESAYRQWGRSGAGPGAGAQPSATTTINKDSEGSDSEGEALSHTTPTYGRFAVPQPVPYGPGYPFPPYPFAHPGPSLAAGSAGGPYPAPPPSVLFAQRRWSGWPYSLGTSSPEERGGGVKL